MRNRTAFFATLATSLLVTAIAPASVRDRIYDFTDAYYRTNGIDPAKLGGRKQAPSASAVVDKPFFSYQRDVRIIGTQGGYAANGKPVFFTINAGFGSDAFTKDAAGKKAQQIADKFVEFMFPSQGSDPVGLGNLRQAAVLDTSGGYFGKNPLGLWLHVWINYTDKAFKTKDGQKELADLKKKNGLAKDGTPIIKTMSEIEKLYKKGFVTKLLRTDGLRYAVCPIMVDPRDGGIAPDAFLSFTKYADGTPVEPIFPRSFLNLQKTGDWDGRP